MKALICYIKDGKEAAALVCDSAVTPARNPFFVPDDRQWNCMVLRGVRIDRLGKGITERFAERYYSECLSAAHPFCDKDGDSIVETWGRDNALIVSELLPAENMDAELKTKINNAISRFSKDMTFKTGDIVLVETVERRPEIEHRSYDVGVPAECGCPPMRLKVR